MYNLSLNCRFYSCFIWYDARVKRPEQTCLKNISRPKDNPSGRPHANLFMSQDDRQRYADQSDYLEADQGLIQSRISILKYKTHRI